MNSTRTRVAGAAIAVVAALAMTGCASSGGQGSSGTRSPATSAAATSSTSSAATSPSSPSSASTSATPTTVVATGRADQPITPPGTRLRLGQSAYLRIGTGTTKDKDASRAIVKVTVTRIRKGVNSDFDVLKNAAQFAGYTPYYIESTDEIVWFEGNRYSLPSVAIQPSGTGEIGTVVTYGGFTACRSATYDTTVSIVGAVRKPCDIAVAGSGGRVTGAAYDGPSSSAYAKSPVTWR